MPDRDVQTIRDLIYYHGIGGHSPPYDSWIPAHSTSSGQALRGNDKGVTSFEVGIPAICARTKDPHHGGGG